MYWILIILIFFAFIAFMEWIGSVVSVLLIIGLFIIIARFMYKIFTDTYKD